MIELGASYSVNVLICLYFVERIFSISVIFVFPPILHAAISFFAPVIPKPDSRSADEHDTHFEDSMKPVPTEQAYDILNANFAFLDVKPE